MNVARPSAPQRVPEPPVAAGPHLRSETRRAHPNQGASPTGHARGILTPRSTRRWRPGRDPFRPSAGTRRMIASATIHNSNSRLVGVSATIGSAPGATVGSWRMRRLFRRWRSGAWCSSTFAAPMQTRVSARLRVSPAIGEQRAPGGSPGWARRGRVCPRGEAHRATLEADASACG